MASKVGLALNEALTELEDIPIYLLQRGVYLSGEILCPVEKGGPAYSGRLGVFFFTL